MRYRSDLLDMDDDEGNSEPFGKVKFIALSAKKNLLAMYCDPDTHGRIIVLKSDLR